MKQDVKIMLKKDIVLNKELSNNALLTYVGLAICLKPGMDYVYADKNILYFYLSGALSSIPRRFDENIRNGLKELIDKQIITCKKKNNNAYYIDIDDFVVGKDDSYIMVYLSEIQKIICCNYHGKISLLRYYIGLLSTFILKNKIKDIRDPDKYNNKLGMISQEYVSDILDVSTHTVVEYTKILEQLELLYVSRCSFMFKDDKGNVKRHNNIYGRYSDKEIIEEFTKIRYNMYDDLHKVKSTNAINNARSLMQKYNCLRNGTEYDKETISAIYSYVSSYNKKYPKKCKDMGVFVKYGCKIDD